VTTLTESVVEDAALAWFESLGYTVKHGPEIARLSTTPSDVDVLITCEG
jgi:hypothetical protein